MLKIWKEPIYFYAAELMILFYICSVSLYSFVSEGVYFGNMLMFIVLLNLEQTVHKCTLLFQHSISVPCLGGQTSSYDLF